VDDEPWPTPVGDEMLVFDITDTLEEQPPRKKAYLDPSDPCLFDVMDNDSEHEQPDVISCCHPERYVGLNASILEFSIRLAAAIQQRDKCFSDLVQPEASPVVQHQPHKGVRRKPFRITICQLTVLTMVAHRRDLSKRFRVPFEGPPSRWPSSTQRRDTVYVRRLVDNLKLEGKGCSPARVDPLGRSVPLDPGDDDDSCQWPTPVGDEMPLSHLSRRVGSSRRRRARAAVTVTQTRPGVASDSVRLEPAAHGRNSE
jgi:hypothetical protein